ncbi:MAG: alanine racemase [Subdoligranulum sp.]|nr:alanine racemase [Subdoligranulum sp.]
MQQNTLNNSYLLVDLGQIRRNAEAILASLPAGTELIPVLKDDGYGLGQVQVARVLSGLPRVDLLAVAHLSEGAALRQAGIGKDILIMGGAPSHLLCVAVEHRLTLAAGRLGMVPALADLARRAGCRAAVQVKIETGLHRIGLCPGAELDALMDELRRAGDAVQVTGAFTHFADVSDPERVKQQQRDFLSGVEQLAAGGFPVPLRHIAASAASEYLPQYCLDAVRVGRRLYMDHPTAPLGTVREAVSWRTWVTNLRALPAGAPVGYAGRCTLKRDALVATIGVGYGDGLQQELCRLHAPVLVRGKRCPLLACCMDQAMVDVSGTDCRVDDEVTLFGCDGQGNSLSAQEAALLIGDDEGCGLTAALTHRVARVYTGGGSPTFGVYDKKSGTP